MRAQCAVCMYGIYCACLKWMLPELSFSDRWSRGTKLWERDCPWLGRLPFDQKFRCEFPEISRGEWYSIFRLTAPECKTISPFHSHFCPQKLKMADSPELLLALKIFSDLEFIIDELMVDDDDIIVLSAIGRCYMRRNRPFYRYGGHFEFYCFK